MRLLATCALAVILAAPVCAGPVLDEILNYMFMDQSVPMKHGARLFDLQRKINLTPDTPIGQTFVTGPETERIFRVRASLAPDWDWQIG